MDYLLNTYFFRYLPFDVSDEWRKGITTKAVDVVRFFDWLCKAQDIRKFYDNHTSFFIGEIVFFFLCLLTFIHAFRHGNRYMYTWIGILIHALNVENLCYWIPELDNFWQAQGFLTLFGMRAPLSIILGIYHMFDYVSYVFVQRMHLPWWAEGPAVGLGAVMLDMPYDLMGIKLVWWTWHDTDPNIYDRMYWVPWNSYYFHASFACSFVWILNISRMVLLSEVYDWKKFSREFLCVFMAGTLAFWLGTLQFAMFYHPIHDIFKVHTEITTIVFLAFYAIIVFIADRRNSNPESRAGNAYWFDELSLAVVVHYMFYMMLVLVADPKNIVSEGLHQPIGPCNDTQLVHTPTGMLLERNKYLCAKNFDEKHFDFHCIPGGKPPSQIDAEPLEWYAICGTDFANRAEYIVIIWSICILFSLIFYQAASRSGRTPRVYRLIYRKTEPSPKINKSRDTAPLLEQNEQEDDERISGEASTASTASSASSSPGKSPGGSARRRGRSSGKKDS